MEIKHERLLKELNAVLDKGDVITRQVLMDLWLSIEQETGYDDRDEDDPVVMEVR